jgi:hypothetical protein
MHIAKNKIKHKKGRKPGQNIQVSSGNYHHQRPHRTIKTVLQERRLKQGRSAQILLSYDHTSKVFIPKSNALNKETKRDPPLPGTTSEGQT